MSVLPQWSGAGFALPATDDEAIEAGQLQQWWGGLSPDARAAFVACAQGPIPAEHLDAVLAGGIRVVGLQRGDAPMVWHFAARVQNFIANAPEPRPRGDIHPLGAS